MERKRKLYVTDLSKSIPKTTAWRLKRTQDSSPNRTARKLYYRDPTFQVPTSTEWKWNCKASAPKKTGVLNEDRTEESNTEEVNDVLCEESEYHDSNIANKGESSGASCSEASCDKEHAGDSRDEEHDGSGGDSEDSEMENNEYMMSEEENDSENGHNQSDADVNGDANRSDSSEQGENEVENMSEGENLGLLPIYDINNGMRGSDGK